MADQSDMTPQLPPPPPAVRRAVLVLSLILGASSLLGLWLAFMGAGSVVIGMLGFELVVLVAAVIAVLAGLGRFRSGYALALACVGGTVFGATVLGFVDGRPNFVSSPDLARVLRLMVYARVLLAGLLGAGAALAVLSRDASSWGSLGRGLAVGSPVVVVGALAILFARDWLTVPRDGVLEAVRIGSIILGVLVLGGFFCASVHLVIRAFQAGDVDRSPENDGA